MKPGYEIVIGEANRTKTCTGKKNQFQTYNVQSKNKYATFDKILFYQPKK